jgi:hypothetical protein
VKDARKLKIIIWCPNGIGKLLRAESNEC